MPSDYEREMGLSPESLTGERRFALEHLIDRHVIVYLVERSGGRSQRRISATLQATAFDSRHRPVMLELSVAGRYVIVPWERVESVHEEAS